MTEPKQDVAAGYGEGDIEAKALTHAAQGRRKPGGAAAPPPAGTFIPAAGTTETDIAENLQNTAARESKS